MKKVLIAVALLVSTLPSTFARDIKYSRIIRTIVREDIVPRKEMKMNIGYGENLSKLKLVEFDRYTFTVDEAGLLRISGIILSASEEAETKELAMSGDALSYALLQKPTHSKLSSRYFYTGIFPSESLGFQADSISDGKYNVTIVIMYGYVSSTDELKKLLAEQLS